MNTESIREEKTFTFKIIKVNGVERFDMDSVEAARFFDKHANIIAQRKLNRMKKALIATETQKARLGLLDYFDQVPSNELMDWKSLFADTRKLLEQELTKKG